MEADRFGCQSMSDASIIAGSANSKFMGQFKKHSFIDWVELISSVGILLLPLVPGSPAGPCGYVFSFSSTWCHFTFGCLSREGKEGKRKGEKPQLEITERRNAKLWWNPSGVKDGGLLLISNQSGQIEGHRRDVCRREWKSLERWWRRVWGWVKLQQKSWLWNRQYQSDPDGFDPPNTSITKEQVSSCW